MDRTARLLSGAAILVCLLSLRPEARPAVAAQAEGELLAIARTYLDDRAARLTTDAPEGELTRAPVTDALRRRLAADALAIDRRRELLRSVNGGHDRAEVTVQDARFDHDHSHEGEGGAPALYLTERTKLFPAGTLPDAPQAEQYQLRHRFTFEKTADGRWRLASAVPELAEGGLPPDTHP
ncbi:MULTISPECIES: hypothetical protein [unclassified Nonomuraea]|uniref:hypothetical protein n=1 Tax=unclassified Nonomuraea TaxID=2593643 RepID=UPI0035BF344D